MPIDSRRDEVDYALGRCRIVRDLMGGTPIMRSAGYIQRGSVESDDDFNHRINGAILYNAYKRTVGYLAGQVFKKDVELAHNVQMETLFNNMRNDVDFQGNNLRTFAQSFFIKGLNDGVRFLLTMYPHVRMNEFGEYLDTVDGMWKPRDIKSENKNRWRPYLYQFGYDQLLGWRYEYENGVRVLTMLRIKEIVHDKGEYDTDDEEIEQIRVLERGRWTTWRKYEMNEAEFKAKKYNRGYKDGKHYWVEYDAGDWSISEIPLSIFMPGEPLSEMTALPALEDLAYLNTRHFIATADQHVLMSYVRRPPWFGRQIVNTDDATVTFGPGHMVHSTHPTSMLQSVGVNTDSVAKGESELKDIEDRMSLYGLMMLTPIVRGRGTAKTATQSQQELTEATSQLLDWALAMKDCFDNAFKFAAFYEGLELNEEPEMKVNVEFQAGFGLEPQFLLQAIESAVLTPEVVFNEFRRRGLIADSNLWEDLLPALREAAAAAVPDNDVVVKPDPNKVAELDDLVGD